MTNAATIREVVNFFAKPENHLDEDVLLVSKEELQAARGKASEAVDRLIDGVSVDSASYDAIRGIQKEGWRNDHQISMRDLYAAARGTSYEGGDISGAQETMFSRLRQSTDKISGTIRQANRASNDPNNQTAAKVGNSIFFIHGGRIIQRDVSTGKMNTLPGLEAVSAVLSYRGGVIAARDAGDVYLWHAANNQWIGLWYDAQRVFSDGRDLVVMTGDGKVWAYRGEPGGLKIKVTPKATVMFNAATKTSTSTTKFIPTVNGRQVVFDNTGIEGASNISQGADGAILIDFDNGDQRNYSALLSAQ